MRTFPDLRMRALVEDAHRAQQLLDQSQHAEARDLFAGVRARARKLGIDSAYLAWGIAICTDLAGDAEMAFTVARALGDQALAAECDAQAAGIATKAVPFAIPATLGPAC